MNTTSAAAPETQRRLPDSPPSVARLTLLELRKVLDTRSGRWFLIAVAVLVAAGLAYTLAQSDGTVSFRDAFSNPRDLIRLLLPVLGVLAMTGEWTQRTALTTFTLVPQRGRVLVAKLAAVLVIAVCVVLVAAAVCAVAVTVTGSVTDLAGAGGEVGAALISTALWMLMGAGFGALLQSTPAALVTYLVLPSLASAGAVVVLGDSAGAWVNIVTALADVSRLQLPSPVAPPLTAIALWVALPLVVGAVRTLRREVS